MPCNGPVIPFWCNGRISPHFCDRHIEITSMLVHKSCQVFSSFVSCMREESGRADIEELEEMDASETHARRLNAKEVLTQQRSGNFVFSIADGTVKILGGEQRLRTSTLTRDCPERGEEQEVLRH